jgi:23S rRNA (adenine2503-C2)-methyltransferase
MSRCIRLTALAPRPTAPSRDCGSPSHDRNRRFILIRSMRGRTLIPGENPIEHLPTQQQPSNWLRLLGQQPAQGLWRRERWRWLRHGQPPAVLLPEEGWHWRVVAQVQSTDGRAQKLRLESRRFGDACESVVLRPSFSRATVCVSTQVGCAVGCTFCATGTMGLRRNLSPEEILEQVLSARERVHARHRQDPTPVHLRNVAFMGMGEPLHNDVSLHEALDWLVADRGFGFSPRHLTVSTAGVPRKMVELAERHPRLRIALSLHAAIPELRRRLVPHATSDLEALRQAIREINRIDPDGPVWIEIALLEGINDQLEHAQAIHRFCEGLRVELNVIPYNDASHAEPRFVKPSASPGLLQHAHPMKTGATPGLLGHRAPSRSVQQAFVRELRRAGWYTTLRNSLGDSIQAACGQLVVPSTVPDGRNESSSLTLPPH